MRRPACALTILSACALGACGSSSHPSAGGGAPSATSDTASFAASGDCRSVAAATLGEVGRRIYRQAAAGHGVAEAVARVERSPALATAISSGDAGAARAALNALLANQIARIDVLKSGRPFASAGSGPAIAPVRGTLPGGASYVLSVQADDSYTKVTKQVTGAEILLLSGSGSSASRSSSRRLAGTIAGPQPARIPARGAIEYKNQKYVAVSLDGQVFPSGPLRIVLLVPRSALRCAGSRAQTHVATLGRVGERIYQEEAGSDYVRATLAHIEADAGFQRAVAARDLAATRAAIVGFFAAHIHVVRVRVNVSEPSGAQRFFYDLGGPYVLAPVHGTLRSAGKLVGRFSFAIQDDAGYMKLAHRFTGAEVLMRTGEKQVQGTLQPGPASVPARGRVGYRGRDYDAYSFTGEAFPSGPLRISLLVARD